MALRPPRCRSVVSICALLSTEGFSDFVGNQIEKYWLSSSGLTERQLRQIERLQRELTDLCHGMTEGQRRVLGKFIGLHKKMSFDTALRIGLTMVARATLKPDPKLSGAMPAKETESYECWTEQEQSNAAPKKAACKSKAKEAPTQNANPRKPSKKASGARTVSRKVK